MTVETTFLENGDKVVVGTNPSTGEAYGYVIRDDVAIELWSENSPTGRLSFDPETGLRLVNGALPVPDVVETDNAPGASWTKRMEFHHSDGVVQRIVTLRADGVTVEEWMRFGQVSSRWQYDAGDAYDWMMQGQELDRDGIARQQSVRTDDLVESYTSDAARLSANRRDISYDPGDVHDWFKLEVKYEAEVLTERETIFDDGVTISETFTTTGLRRETEYTDPLNARSWDWRIETYDAAGLLVVEDQGNDDGTVQTRDYVDGVLVQTEWHDTDDVHYWSLRRHDYDYDTGALIGEMLLRDDGIEFATLYDTGGQGTLHTLSDTDDIRDWTWQRERTDAEGQTQSTSIRYDDGTEREQTYSDGVVTRTETVDTGDIYDWTRRVEYSDDVERTNIVEVYYDDGVEETSVTGWAESAPYYTRAVDVEDAHDWEHISERYDLSTGLRSREEILFDDGVIKRTYFGLDENISEIYIDDHEDAYDWDIQQTKWDPITGQMTFDFFRWDDWSSTEERFEDGILSYRRVVDLLDDGTPVITIERFEEGVLRKRSVGQNDLSDRVELYNATGALIELFELDNRDEYSWYEKQTHYGPAGQVWYTSVSSDNGIEQERYFENGVHVATEWSDRWDTEYWSRRSVVYDEYGRVISHSVTRDDGIRIETFPSTLEGPRRTEYTDYEDIRPWNVRIEYVPKFPNYTQVEDIFLDDGVQEIVIRDRDGELTRKSGIDLADVYDWDHYNAYFFAGTETLRARDVHFDDWVILFEGYTYSGDLEYQYFDDDQDAHPWTSRLIRYDPETGTRTQETTEWDDGSSDDWIFDAGNLVSHSRWDAAENAEWRLIITSYESLTQTVTERFKVRDDGMEETETFFTSGVVQTRLRDDVEDTQSWQSVLQVYDTEGHLQEWRLIEDDDVETVRSYEDGLHQATIWTDWGDVHYWSEKSVTYDETGAVASRTLLRDDGILFEDILDNPLWRIEIKTDTLDIRDWAEIYENYRKPDDDLNFRRTTGDDGVIETVSYDSTGALDRVTRQDTLDIHDWETTFETFPTQARDITVSRLIGDDGIITTDSFQFGTHISTQIHSDPQVWNLLEETLYDESGARIQHREFAPNGLEWVSRYEDGLLVEKRSLDHEDAYSWQERIRTYDPDGNLLTFEQIPDEAVLYT